MTGVDAPSLTPNVANLQHVASFMMEGQKGILDYVMAVARIQSDPQSIGLDGFRGHIDPFEYLPPAFKTAVLAAQDHSQTYFPNVMIPLSNWGSTTVPGFSRDFNETTESILKAIRSVNGVPTPQQRKEVSDGFTAIEHGLARVESEFSSIRTTTLTFLDSMRADYRVLMSGDNTIENARKALEQRFLDEEMKYVGTAGGLGVAKIIQDVGGRYSAMLDEVKQQVHDAGYASAQAASSVSNLQEMMTELRDKAGSVSMFVIKAENANFASSVQRIDLRAAAAAWQQFADFTKAGLY